MSSTLKQQNLQRIRDNQRRSRARRKEYQQQLETRLRNYELQGIEASREIQEAARRVTDENNKLRSLLMQHGIEDDTILAYLQSTSTNDNLISNDTAQTIELHQSSSTSYMSRNISTPMHSMAGEPGSLGPSIFSTFNLEGSPWANNKQLEKYSLFVTNERSGLAKPPDIPTWQHLGWSG